MQQTCQTEHKLATGRWTKEQHQRFMYAIMQFGKDWRKVQQYVRTRSSSQVRSHAQKFFNKLQKGTQGNTQPNSQHPESNRRQQEYSQTQFDIEREMNNEQTPSTPMELVSLIRKQSKEDGGKINLTQLKKSLDQHQQNHQQIKNPPNKEIEALQKGSSFKSMSNILSAYEQVNNRQIAEQDQSFFISITKKYKKLFKQVQDFDRLIDLHQTNQHPQQFTRNRKRSFTLPEGSNVEQEELDEKIEEIKKKINVENKEEKKEKRERERERERERKKERKDSDSSIQYMPPPLNKLTTIQEQPREEDENLSFRALLSQEKLDETKQ